MKKLNLLHLLVILFLFTVAFNACDKEDNEFVGKNEIFFLCDGEKSLIETEDKEIEVKVTLSRTVKEDVTLEFLLKEKAADEQNILEFVENPITIKAGENSALLKVKSKKNELLTEDTSFDIDLKTSTDQNISVNEVFTILVKPSPRFTPLTEAQKQLVEGYKSSKGLDLSLWIGIIPVKVKVTYPGGGYLEPFTNQYERNIEGKTVITLSNNATVDNPALVMTCNAMGLAEYLYEILKDETILDKEYWCQTPMPQKTIELLGLSEDKEETFDVKLDDIVFDTENKKVNFVSSDKAKDVYGDPMNGVGFEYSYSAWDRMQKLIKEGNQDAIDANDQGGSVDPEVYLNNTNILEDEWYETNWVAPTSSYDEEKGEMKFVFNFDHYNAGDYVKVEVIYQSPKK